MAKHSSVFPMSPPGQILLDSFTTSPTMAKASCPQTLYPMSPPVSPEFMAGPPEVPHSQRLADPILFDNGSPSSQLLFDNESFEAQRVVEGHVAAREDSLFRQSSPPKAADYKLVLEFKSKVFREYNNNRKLWQRRELAYLKEDSELQSASRPYHPIAIAPKVRERQPVVRDPLRSCRAGVIKTPVPKQKSRQQTPNPERKVAREDKDFDALPDYSPPTSSLPSKPNSLKVDWKGAPIDLRHDPHASLLHPDEVALAANLRLDCATYLTSKRRVFIRRLECLQRGKEFRKTDAQQACKIDVNKASKLWAAFEKVGWLKESWVRQYL